MGSVTEFPRRVNCERCGIATRPATREELRADAVDPRYRHVVRPKSLFNRPVCALSRRPARSILTEGVRQLTIHPAHPAAYVLRSAHYGYLDPLPIRIAAPLEVLAHLPMLRTNRRLHGLELLIG